MMACSLGASIRTGRRWGCWNCSCRPGSHCLLRGWAWGFELLRSPPWADLGENQRSESRKASSFQPASSPPPSLSPAVTQAINGAQEALGILLASCEGPDSTLIFLQATSGCRVVTAERSPVPCDPGLQTLVYSCVCQVPEST